jgi:hypothetical protein
MDDGSSNIDNGDLINLMFKPIKFYVPSCPLYGMKYNTLS